MRAVDQFAYVDQHYGLKVKRGTRVLALGKPGQVTSADQYVYVRLDGAKYPQPYHPDDIKLVTP